MEIFCITFAPSVDSRLGAMYSPFRRLPVNREHPCGNQKQVLYRNLSFTMFIFYKSLIDNIIFRHSANFWETADSPP
jgi:hypothetical protein